MVDQEKADSLLVEHHHWQKNWRPKIGYGNAAPECRQAVSSRQFDSTSDITREIADNLDMESVDWCLDHVSFNARLTIGHEMMIRDKRPMLVNAPMKYEDALQEILPFMRKRSLL